jgi:hypothetical protein
MGSGARVCARPFHFTVLNPGNTRVVVVPTAYPPGAMAGAGLLLTRRSRSRTPQSKLSFPLTRAQSAPQRLSWFSRLAALWCDTRSQVRRGLYHGTKVGTMWPLHIDRIPNRSSRPAYLLRESILEGKCVRKRTLASLSPLSDEQIVAIRDLAWRATGAGNATVRGSRLACARAHTGGSSRDAAARVCAIDRHAPV